MQERKDVSEPAASAGARPMGEPRRAGERRLGPDRRQARAPVEQERRSGYARRLEARQPPGTAASPGPRSSAPRTSLGLSYPEGSPVAPRLRQLTHLELPEPDAQRHWGAIARHRENLLHQLGRDVGLRVAVLDYFLSIRPQVADLSIIESSALEAIERSAILDSLTNVFNREYFYTALVREVERCKRHRGIGSLVMLDVDDFKALNDRLGHAAGDRALRELGELIRRHLRAVDVPCRYGGDEFAVLLPDTDREEAHAVGERIRIDVSSFFRQHPVGGHALPLTVSGGVATCYAGVPAADAVIEVADRLLYAAKREGRNRIAVRPKSEESEHT
jgi:diguanylate cyclase (GGDEF)-like protein